jgi:hypothetical protein
MLQQWLLSHQKEQLPAGFAAVFCVICGSVYSMLDQAAARQIQQPESIIKRTISARSLLL